MGTAVQEFQKYQHWILDNGIKTLTPSGLLLGCLLGFDAFVLEEDIQHAYAACISAIRNANDVRISWVVKGRIDARHLSVMSTITLTRLVKHSDFESSRHELLNAYIASQKGGGEIESINWLWWVFRSTVNGDSGGS